MSDLKNKRVITAAITGSWPTREQNPNLSITPEEIAADVYECWKAGAAIAHIHVRNDDGTPSTDFMKYKETIERIRAYKDCDICINITSSGSVGFGDEERIYPLQKLLPEMASYDAGTLNWQHRTIFENHPRFLEKLGHALIESNIKPEIEIFDAGMIYNAIYYMKKGVLKAPCHFQIVLGCPGGMTNTVENLVFLKSLIPDGSTWAACGIGAGHMPIMMAGIAMGAHIRVGMEDNVMWQKGVPAESNAQFVKRAKELLEMNGLEAATPEEARKIYGLTRKVF
ncbi:MULTISPECIES: 3-keto-5-aminohexanoate cleavage protein [Fusobacterium]|jgi:3-keto-5-aminohexanoate cleavage enzyme|uniref:3-keto-5-aminohexanoate cleavage protein n=1 Tax=Fusobacterium TaxID=848 RepID=UPI0008A53DCC|nr:MULTISPECIES: 3-keto-5-aminohexanoate cleavage protein [Fusobacterium]MCD7979271.1 3-keto-5-aminohexanoate cleavage protein [Fusobacterium sp.]MCF0169286.1 3-keto-5-aminohexanoate cleavage protein [Fusobacterium varium]MCI6033722.1 3-keto-5-aminohexanoate cleavage protein [Fusobacterium varium]MDY4004629.1 3-keto-5-aminohexanoate cleavage protein [Fusobacterium varium]OFL91555.1 3-keto-5-aminohexanoate cleavage protein [Fusobacterium sp. HMSC073F01]